MGLSMSSILPIQIRNIRDLARDDRGNVAMMVAISIVPLALGAMGALDLTHRMTAKVELQDALDAAALAAARNVASDPVQLQQVGAQVLAQNLAGAQDVTNVTGSFTFGTGGAVVASASGSVAPMLAGFSGSTGPNIIASNQVVRANSLLEVALVLDNTGSMNQSLNKGTSKISELKSAASSFVDIMSKAAAQSVTANAVRVSMVPFSDTVNVGSSYANADWLDTQGLAPATNQIFTGAGGAPPPATTSVNRIALYQKLGATWGGCVEARAPETTTNGVQWDIDDSPPTKTTPRSLFTPYFAPDEADQSGKGSPSDNDYVADPTTKGLDAWQKQGDTAKYATTPKRSLSTSLGPNAGCSMAPIQRLTTDFPGLKTQINGLKAGGNTNIPMGLMWGWHTLSPNAPFADGVAYGSSRYRKVVVLMTDGENTIATNSTINASTYAGYGYLWEGRLLQADGTPLTSIPGNNPNAGQYALDSRLTLLCTKMKSNNIEIYTIGVGVSSASKTLLQSCATDVNHYFNVTNGADMTMTFQAVANQIAALHLSR